MEPNDYVNKYVDVSYSNGNGGSGWVKSVQEEEGVTYIVFDYGYAFPITDEATIKEVEPPVGDQGMFNG